MTPYLVVAGASLAEEAAEEAAEIDGAAGGGDEIDGWRADEITSGVPLESRTVAISYLKVRASPLQRGKSGGQVVVSGPLLL